ncbi:hydantoinase/oxoprolinase family protein [Roseicyclus sp. F158]|uniref:Hydantoinase/oxoprolinase family protein n=1 Tax=Tropicimonas omnivorans TaxID=3075590 RepID=A0ABU3DEQ8_9RHOB|nr:hydantoinase/oxoprolinase family protein [Roseicyclus sp. F158]MDT0681612.1 hydantoinase/oxoprolinase family protein [Roseicyclus sp. F158]
MTSTGQWRIGIDVGGTFNDLVAEDLATGRRVFHKEPSVPSDPSLAVQRGMTGLLDVAGLAPGDIGAVMHGTTLALNTILQRQGARVAAVVSRGNRHVFEIARAQLPAAIDFTHGREEPLVPADRVFETEARIGADGTIVAPVDDAEMDRLAEDLRRAGAEAVAVMLLNSYRHPALEAEIAEALTRRLPDLPVVASAAIWPEAREYERGLLAALNASIRPLMGVYFERLTSRLGELGIDAPLFITTNNGGTVSLQTALDRPIDTVLSGPAAGVTAAIDVAPPEAGDNLVTFDMGGTSADMSIIAGRAPELTSAARVGDFPIMLPVVSVTAIGAGGGSILWRDAQGVLKIGPESAGSDPGPIAYGRGGTRPTITDCYLATGIVDPARFLGGRMALDGAAAAAGLATLGRDLGLEGDEDVAARAAHAGLRVATAMMGVDLSKLLARRGLDLRDFTMVAYGGAGATHATMLAREAGLSRVLIPRAPGTFCALGASIARIQRDFVASLGYLLGTGKSNAGQPVKAALDRLSSEAAAWARGEAAGDAAAPRISAMVRARFPDQAYDLELEFGADALALQDAAGLEALILDAFHDRHHTLYGFEDRATPVLAGLLRVTVTIPAERPASPPPTPAKTVPAEERRVWDGAWLDAQVLDRASLPPGARITGPALLEQPDTTIWIVPGWTGEVLPDGNLMVTQEAGDAAPRLRRPAEQAS